MTAIEAGVADTPAAAERIELGTLASIELRAHATQLEERISRAREDLAIARAAEAEDKRALSDPDAKTSDLARKALARAREDVDRAESAHERMVADLQPELEAVIAAVDVAERREAETELRAEFAALDAKIRAQHLKLATALAELGQAEAELVVLGGEQRRLRARAARDAPGATFEVTSVIESRLAPDFTTMERFVTTARSVAGIPMTLDRERMTWSRESDPDA